MRNGNRITKKCRSGMQSEIKEKRIELRLIRNLMRSMRNGMCNGKQEILLCQIKNGRGIVSESLVKSI